MPRPRTPLEQAEATGAVDHNRKRFADRQKAPKYGGELGPAPDYFTPEQIMLWEALVERIPKSVLVAADTYIVELTVVQLYLFRQYARNGNLPTASAMAELRKCMASLGMTPADRTRVSGSDDEPADRDPIDLLLGGPPN